MLGQSIHARGHMRHPVVGSNRHPSEVCAFNVKYAALNLGMFLATLGRSSPQLTAFATSATSVPPMPLEVQGMLRDSVPLCPTVSTSPLRCEPKHLPDVTIPTSAPPPRLFRRACAALSNIHCTKPLPWTPTCIFIVL
jgi:hypothetical protein